jgi:hypothetical protein
VFTSYGAICWLSDLDAWARGISGVLKLDGRFVFMEFHPFVMLFDERWQLQHDYFNAERVEESGVGDYVAESGDGLTLGRCEEGVRNFRNPHRCFEFFWGWGR